MHSARRLKNYLKEQYDKIKYEKMRKNYGNEKNLTDKEIEQRHELWKRNSKQWEG